MKWLEHVALCLVRGFATATAIDVGGLFHGDRFGNMNWNGEQKKRAGASTAGYAHSQCSQAAGV